MFGRQKQTRIKRQEIKTPSPSPKKRRQNPDSQQQIGRSNKVAPVPEEDSLDIEDFVNQYKCSKQPVLIKYIIKILYKKMIIITK